MAITKYERGDLLFEDDFTGTLSAWNIYEYDGKESSGNSYAEVRLENNQLVLYTQHDGTSGTQETSRPVDSIAAVETSESWDRSSFVELEFSYTYDPTWKQYEDESKAPYIPGVEWGDLGDDPYKVTGDEARNYPMRDGWANRYGEREWGVVTDEPQVANDRYDDYEINTAKNSVSKLSESNTHYVEAVAVDEEAVMSLERSNGSEDEVQNTLADIIGASGYAFVTGENIGIADDQTHVYASGDAVALSGNQNYVYQSGNEISTTDSVSVSDQLNHLVFENRIINNFEADSEAWIDIRIDYVKVWEAVVA